MAFLHAVRDASAPCRPLRGLLVAASVTTAIMSALAFPLVAAVPVATAFMAVVPATAVMAMVPAAAVMAVIPAAAVITVVSAAAMTVAVSMAVTMPVTMAVAVTIAVTAASSTVVRAAAECAGGALGVGPDEVGGGKCGTGRHDILVPPANILKRRLVAGGEGRFARGVGACL
ncbi:hypothetical protein [Shinella sp.]|uniref:hypothetical protein n=1 Tax=Shinella sp. TaxID=1870904 RepID=UPI00301CAF32